MERSWLERVLGQNWYLVFFVYGLAFFLMGFGIALLARRPSAFRLGRHLKFLAGFGLLHGAAEWAYIFLTPGVEYGGWETFRGAVLGGSHALLIALSFAFLFAFGVELSGSTWGWPHWGKRLAAVLFGLWFSVFALWRPRSVAGVEQWLTVTEILARYSLAFPGALFSSLGIMWQRRELKGLRHPPLERSLKGASLAFMLYTFAGGLVVPPAPFFPASVLNTSLMLRLGFPVQLLRAVAGVLIAYFVIRSLEFYEVEDRRRWDNLLKRETLWLERERIRRDLHDGITQELYSLALGLDYALNLLELDPQACRNKIKELRDRVDELINRLRRYLKGLEYSGELPAKAVALVEELLADHMAQTDQRTHLSVWGDQPRPLSAPQREHLYHMLKEIFSNIRRHSRASEVEVELHLLDGGLHLLVRDNGVGFDPQRVTPSGMGLINLRERSALAGGWVDIRSAPGRGTEIEVWMPYTL